MNKIQMAHEMALAIQGTKLLHDMELVSEMSWKYADAMQAEADKRECKRLPYALLTKDKDGNCLHFNREFGHKKCMDCGASLEEWQPDWSQAPSGALSYHIELDELDGSVQPFWTDSLETHFDGEMFVGYKCAWNAPSFSYQGNWQDSLRKRPEALCEVDWRVAPCWAKEWVMRDGVARWEYGTCANSWEFAPSFGFTGTHIVERPQ